MHKSTKKPVVVIPSLNEGNDVLLAVESLLEQTLQAHIIVVNNASTDGSPEKLAQTYPHIEYIHNARNEGYTGGVNPGFQRAIELGAIYTAPFNADAVADKRWLEQLVDYMDAHPLVAVAAPKVVTMDGKRLDSTGDYYTNWGLTYPRGRDENNIDKYDAQTDIFAATGAASLYRVETLKQVGLLDQDFFAYYEDVDLSFRMQLAGWKVAFVPGSLVYHRIGKTSSSIKGFTTYHTMKNLPILWFKNVPRRYFWGVGLRLALAHTLFFGRAITRGQGWIALKGATKGLYLLCTKLPERRRIQGGKTVSDTYIWGMFVHDLPPNAKALRRLRAGWWKITGRNA